MVTIKVSVIRDFNYVSSKFFLFFLILQIKIVQRPKLTAVHGHYDYYYAQLDMLRRRAHEPSYCWVPQEDPGVEENYSQEESHTVHHQVNGDIRA